MKRLSVDRPPRSAFFTMVCDHRGRAAFGLAVWLLAAPSTPAASDEIRLSLRDAIDLGRENAYEVQAAYHDSLAAEHGLSAAKRAWFPSAGVLANALAFYPIDPINPFGPGPVQLGSDWQNVYVTNLRLNYPIYTGGRRTNGIRRSRESARAAASDLSASRLSNVYECRQAYIGLLIADRIVDATEASLARIEIMRQDVANLHAAGMADSVDILDTQLSVRQVRRLLEESRTRRLNASAVLARLLGLSTDVVIMPTEAVPAPSLDSSARPPAREAVSRRAELAAMDHRISAATHERSMVRANLLPVINTMGGYAVVKPEVGSLGGDWQDLWWVGLSLSWDLNLGGKEFSESAQALEKVRMLEMQRRALESALALQAQVAWNNVEEAYNLFRLRDEEYAIATRRFELSEGQRQAGQITVNRALELEAELTQAGQEFETARLRFFAAWTDYLYAIGSDALWGGF
jgi:outer membrane protein TolC